MINNTAEGQINIVYPYKVDATIVDISGREELLASIPQGESFAETLLKDLPFGQQNSNILIEERLYMIYLQVFDKDENLITLTDNLQFDTLKLFDQP